MTTPFELITSTANPRVRQAARLRESGARRESGLTLVDGRRELHRAAVGGVAIVEVFLDAEAPADADRDAWLSDLAGSGTHIVALSRRAFEKIAFGSRNEGLVGVVRFATRTLAEFQPVTDQPVIVVEGVEKPGNLGAILRTADAAGIAGVIACGPGTDPANPACVRASLGTVFSVPLAVGTSCDAIAWCASSGRRVMAAMPEGDRLWHDARLAGATAIVLGSEAHGVSAAWREADESGRIALETIRLPMHGIADSLNVSATAAILAYEAVRQASEKVRSRP